MSDEVIGPTLPPNWESKKKSGDSEGDNKDNESCVYGPTLPTVSPSVEPKLSANASTSRVIGPSIPPDFNKRKRVAYDSDSDSDDMIGPIPQTHHKFDKINEKFGNVSQILAEKEAQKQVKREREEWMTLAPKQLTSKLPTKSVKHFSQRPAKSYDKNLDKNYKSDDKRDKKLNQIMDSLNKSQKRDVSLIDIHNEKTKKSNNSDSNGEERIPFDREKDLTVRRMDARQTKSVLNKAKTFNDRFSLGINKFL